MTRRPGLVEREEKFRGRVISVEVDTVRFPDGSTGRLEVVRHPGASAVVPLLDPVEHPDPRLVLIRQYRYAAGGHILEVPAGIPRPGEEAEVCASRELEEETGYRAGELRHLTDLFTTPGFTDEEIHLFLATALTPGSASPDGDEFIQGVELPLSKVLTMIGTGEIRDGKSVAAILYVHSFLRS